MKNGLKVVMIAAAVLLMVGAVNAAERSLSTHMMSQLPPVAQGPVDSPKAVSTAILDGGFEYGPGAGIWTERTSTTCSWVLNPTSIWGIGPHSGFYCWWAGGYCGPANSNSVTQSLLIPVGTTSVDMYNVFYRVDADEFDGDRFLVRLGPKVLGQVAFESANNTYPSFVLTSFPVPGNAGGQTATLHLKGQAFGSLSGNSLVDDVSLTP
jgi:hypothetical protein